MAHERRCDLSEQSAPKANRTEQTLKRHCSWRISVDKPRSGIRCGRCRFVWTVCLVVFEESKDLRIKKTLAVLSWAHLAELNVRPCPYFIDSYFPTLQRYTWWKRTRYPSFLFYWNYYRTCVFPGVIICLAWGSDWLSYHLFVDSFAFKYGLTTLCRAR